MAPKPAGTVWAVLGSPTSWLLLAVRESGDPVVWVAAPAGVPSRWEGPFDLLRFFPAPEQIALKFLSSDPPHIWPRVGAYRNPSSTQPLPLPLGPS